jgi:sporulation protein YtfJ
MNQQHPIEGLMKTAMENIRGMIEVNTVIGDAIETSEGTIIMPITKAAFGFVAGGAEYSNSRQGSRQGSNKDSDGENSNSFPFGGGSGSGVSVQPVAFMVVDKNKVQMMHVTHLSPVEKILEETPQVLSKMATYFQTNSNSQGKKKKEQKEPKEEKSSQKQEQSQEEEE